MSAKCKDLSSLGCARAHAPPQHRSGWMRLQLLPECMRQRHRVVAARELLPRIRKPELHRIQEVRSGAMPYFGLAPLVSRPEKDCASEDPPKGIDEARIMSAIRRHAPFHKELSSAAKSNLPSLVPHCLCRQEQDQESILTNGTPQSACPAISRQNRPFCRRYVSVPVGSRRIDRPHRIKGRAPNAMS